jgi:hypothetical protein
MPDRASVCRQVRGPAIGLVVTAVAILFEMIVLQILGVEYRWGASIRMLSCMGPLVAIGVLLFGAMKMATLQSRGWAIAAIILAMLPVGHHCFIGIPIGIWALRVLNRPEVRAAFALSRPDHRLPVARLYVPPLPPVIPPPEPPRPDVPSTPFHSLPAEDPPIARKIRSFWRSFRTMFFSRPDGEKAGPDELG